MSLSTAADTKHNLNAVREAYYNKISEYDMAPLWEVLKNVVTKDPRHAASQRS
jgi:gentisate 1,2-dioxygenase